MNSLISDVLPVNIYIYIEIVFVLYIYIYIYQNIKGIKILHLISQL